MAYYEPRVTQADKGHITHRLSKYVMDIRHDHELYRHLHCYWPDDPIGPNNCSFDVITAPGSITIYGYWAEKLDMDERTKNAAAQSYKKQKQIHRYLTTERHMVLGDLTLPEKPPVVGI